MAVCVSTTPDRTVYGRVFDLARQYLRRGAETMNWNFALSDPQQFEALLLGAAFRDVSVTRETRKVSFDSLDYWAAMEAGGGLSGATYLALSPEDRRTVATGYGPFSCLRHPTGRSQLRWTSWWVVVAANSPLGNTTRCRVQTH